ncbi:MAG: hypothetical protein RQ722_07535 [Desulfuromonadales bacterium]|nr:hypothetical protein [Desulfuromonadales bacterium]
MALCSWVQKVVVKVLAQPVISYGYVPVSSAMAADLSQGAAIVPGTGFVAAAQPHSSPAALLAFICGSTTNAHGIIHLLV